jgi:hypothetical protein
LEDTLKVAKDWRCVKVDGIVPVRLFLDISKDINADILVPIAFGISPPIKLLDIFKYFKLTNSTSVGGMVPTRAFVDKSK